MAEACFEFSFWQQQQKCQQFTSRGCFSTSTSILVTFSHPNIASKRPVETMCLLDPGLPLGGTHWKLNRSQPLSFNSREVKWQDRNSSHLNFTGSHLPRRMGAVHLWKQRSPPKENGETPTLYHWSASNIDGFLHACFPRLGAGFF